MNCPECGKKMEVMNDGAYCSRQDCSTYHLDADDLVEIIDKLQAKIEDMEHEHMEDLERAETDHEA